MHIGNYLDLTFKELFLLWVIKFLLDQRKDCRNHIFGEHLADNSERHAHFNKICALKILKTQNTSTSLPLRSAAR